MKNKIIGISVAMFCVVMSMAQSNNVIDEVAWVVGDEPILGG